jgi:hypothetical protein
MEPLEGLGKFVFAATLAVVKTVAHDGADEAYKEEEKEHPDEDIATHMGHAVGRVVGSLITFGQ